MTAPVISNHPSLTHAEDIKSICQPLEKFKINYFSHVHIDKSNQFSVIASHPAYLENYLRSKHYDIDIHTASLRELGKQIMWDAIELSGKCAKENEEAIEFGVEHVFTLIEWDQSGTHYYHFASNKVGAAINQIYLTQIDLLKLFIRHFKEKISSHKVLHQAYDLKFSIDKNTEGFIIKNDFSQLNHDRTKLDFLKEIQIVSLNNTFSKNLSMRERDILLWLHYGKTANQIAQILNIADITVHKHIANIKEKTGCYTQFQLGEFFSRNICNLNS